MRAEVGIRRGFADTPLGQIHYAEAGEGEPVLLLHQTPRSWDEYRDALPLIGARRRAIAMDTLGFGDSCDPVGPDSIEEYARGVPLLLDALGLDRADLVGHHTGGVIAIDIAAESPARVGKLVLSSTPLIDEEYRREHAAGHGIDDVERSHDGTHLVDLWSQRQPFYPSERADLLERFVADALKGGERLRAAHFAIASYEMERRLSRIRCPTLVLTGGDDPYAHPYAEPLAARIGGARVVVIEGGTVPLPDHMPEEFSRAVLDFLEA